MLCNHMNIEELFKKSLTDDLSYGDFEMLSAAEGVSIEDAFNRISIFIARKFDAGEVSYEDGDYAMNGVWPIMLDFIMKQDIPLVEPCYEIYCAFDAGEYDHRDGADPVEKYTKPAIKDVLKNA
ncbi:Uncharacterised protein [Shewanella putrefaciens]|nr:Uncharacterised protein [Shewanella putrefaciens]